MRGIAAGFIGLSVTYAACATGKGDITELRSASYAVCVENAEKSKKKCEQLESNGDEEMYGCYDNQRKLLRSCSQATDESAASFGENAKAPSKEDRKTSPENAESRAPPSPALFRALEGRGVIPPGGSPEIRTEAFQEYLKQKSPGGDVEVSPQDLRATARRERAMTQKSARTRKSAYARNNGSDGIETKRILTFLVEFSGTDDDHTGPLHNQIEEPPEEDEWSFWIPDFSADHYRTMLFDTTSGARSMSTYFLQQSGGQFTVDGAVTEWVKVPHSEWYYGADGPSGHDNLNGPRWRLVEDAVREACDQLDLDWKSYDRKDPWDLDEDENVDEPDGYVDHIQFVHAGSGQEAGGGAQGDDAIWSHKWWADYGSDAAPGYGGVPTCDPEVWVGPYTMNPEDGTLGVFVHEFAHDLGVPDLYDTIYSGEASTGFWTLMSSGSWLGCPGEPLGTCPASMGFWEKMLLGWVDPVVVAPGEALDGFWLKTSMSRGRANKGIVVQLPDYEYEDEFNTPFSGESQWYSGKGDNLSNTLSRSFPLPTGSAVSFRAWYDIEEGWDYAYVEFSVDGGATWTTIESEITTNDDPNGLNADGNGITGSSSGWVTATFWLPDIGDATDVLLRFRYETDGYKQGEGFAIDDITIAGEPFDDVEDGNTGWTADGWTLSDGIRREEASHYYVAEWRQPAGFDVSMNSWYDFESDGQGLTRIAATPGMLVWYRNERYEDNHVGEHPWEGRLLLVDAHPELLNAEDLGPFFPLRTRLQIADAAFGLTATPEQHVAAYGQSEVVTTIPSLDPISVFDDSEVYVDPTYYPLLGAGHGWLQKAISSVKTPHYGLRIEVLWETTRMGKINVDFSGFIDPTTPSK